MPHPADRVFGPYLRFIPQHREFLEALKGPIPRHIRINSLKADPEEVHKRLYSRRLVPEESSRLPGFFRALGETSPGLWPEFELGYVHTQALTSGIASYALAAEPGMLVLDMCAAPGSKTTHLAQVMENTGLIVANDKSKKRLIALRHNLKRLGVLNTAATAYRGENLPEGVRFERVLVDAPCSGEGGYRADDAGMLKSVPPRRRSLLDLQKRLIVKGFDLLAPRGRMIYATCTYSPLENEAAVDHLLNVRDARILSLVLPGPFEPGIVEFQGDRFKDDVKKCARFYPHRVASVGFFLAGIGKGG